MKKIAIRNTIVALLSLAGVFVTACRSDNNNDATDANTQTSVPLRSETPAVSVFETNEFDIKANLQESSIDSVDASYEETTDNANDSEALPASGIEQLSYHDIEKLYDNQPGNLSYLSIIDSRVRDGFYIVVDYSGIEKDAYYFEPNLGYQQTSMGGEHSLFYFREITLSQGEFLEVFSAAHNGTGRLYLYNNDTNMDLAYTIQATAINAGYDARYSCKLERILTEEQYSVYADNETIIWRYAGGRLNVEYDDYNMDGYTDIKMYGLGQLIDKSFGYKGSATVIAEAMYIVTLYFDHNENDFIINEEEYIPLETEQYDKWQQIWP